MYRLFLAMAFLMIPSLAHAESTIIYREWDNGWMVMAKDQCFAVREYEGGDVFIVGYNPLTNKVYLSITDPDATSLQDDQKVVLHLFFISGETTLDDGWGSSTYTAMKTDDGAQMISSFEGRTMLADLARYNTIAFSIDSTADRVVGVYALDGSAQAMKSLRDCAFSVSGLNPNDPFIK